VPGYSDRLLAEGVLDPIFTAWIGEAELLADFAFLRTMDAGHQWFFDGTEHVDPAKEANAQATRLTSNTTTLAAEYARQGKDWETELRQRAKEQALMKELGLPAVNRAEPTASQAAPEPIDEEDEEVDTDVEQNQAA